jgi:hypothetical protein
MPAPRRPSLSSDYGILYCPAMSTANPLNITTPVCIISMGLIGRIEGGIIREKAGKFSFLRALPQGRQK